MTVQADPGLTAPTPSLAPRRYRVTEVYEELADTTTLAVRPVDEALDDPQPGQFHMMWAPGVGEVPISVSGRSETGDLLHTVRTVGVVTGALGSTEPGAMLGLRGPYGSDWAVESAAGHDVIVVAGGLGLAPLRPAIRSFLADRDRFGSIAVLVGARSPDDLLFGPELDQWAARNDVDVRLTVDVASPGWQGDVGVVPRLVARAPVDFSEAVALVCGPEIMMRFTADALVDRGVDTTRVRVSLERNMHCAIGHCGHCQFGPVFVCTDGPVLEYAAVGRGMKVREL